MVVDLLVDDVDPVVALLPLAGAGQDVVELGFGPNRQAEVIEPRALHRAAVVLGDQEHELLDVVHLEDLALLVDRHHRQVVEAEHVLVEVGAQLAVLFVEILGGQAHRHMIEARLARREGRAGHRHAPCSRASGSTRGTIIALAASSPSCKPIAASSNRFNG